MVFTVYATTVSGLCFLLLQMANAGFNCSFDTDTCGWTQEQEDHFNWTRHMGRTVSPRTGPSFDHTSGHGYYMYIETSDPRLPGEKAHLISPTINITDQMCLVFYYHMYGLHIDKLNVYFSRSGSLGSPVWTKTQPQGNVWKRGIVPLPGGPRTSTVTNIVFESVKGDHFQGDVAIDDVSIQAGTCPPVPSGTIRLSSPLNDGIGRLEVYHNGTWGTVCDNGFTDQAAEVACRQLGLLEAWSKPTTIRVDPGTRRIWLDGVQCNGNEGSLAECDHSPWGSSNCTHSQDVGLHCDTEGLNCTFDTDTCGWTQNRNNEFINWTRSSGGSTGNGIGRNSDHTSGYGSYMYIDTSYPRTEEQVAEISTPRILGTRRACLSFYYHMFGHNACTLKVFFHQGFTYNSPVWINANSQSNTWRKVMLQMAGGGTTMLVTRIAFKGVVGVGYEGTIAIDDVTLTPGTCPREELIVNMEPNLDVIRINKGADLTVKCGAPDIDPDATSIMWFHNGHTSSGPTFRIQKVTQFDEGRLTCSAHSGVGTSPGQADTFIVVQEGPLGSGDVISGSNTVAIVTGILALVVTAVLAVVIIYLYWRHRSLSGTAVMPHIMRNTQDGMNNPLWGQDNSQAENGTEPGYLMREPKVKEWKTSVHL